MTSAVEHKVPGSSGSRAETRPAQSAPRQPYEAFEQFMAHMFNREWWRRGT